MGYYLNIDKPDLGSDGVCLGGKFFGYLDDEDFESCLSYQFLKRILGEDAELLNVWWSCYSFELKLTDAIIFLNLYRRDFYRIEGRSARGIKSVIHLLHEIVPEVVRFEMG